MLLFSFAKATKKSFCEGAENSHVEFIGKQPAAVVSDLRSQACVGGCTGKTKTKKFGLVLSIATWKFLLRLK